MRAAGFGKAVEDIENGICPICNMIVDVNGFKDDISKREFKISGMCQACQDEIFSSKNDL